MTDDPGDDANREIEARKRLFPAALDPEAKHLLRWAEMPEEARAAACVAAMLVVWPLDPATMRYDRARRIAIVVRADPHVKGQSKMATRPVPATAEESLAVIRAAFGHRVDEVVRAIRRRG